MRNRQSTAGIAKLSLNIRAQRVWLHLCANHPNKRNNFVVERRHPIVHLRLRNVHDRVRRPVQSLVADIANDADYLARRFVELWSDYCSDNRLILVMPQSQNGEGWIASESDAVIRCVREAMKSVTVDPQRVVAHGMGVGGQMALHLGMNNRDLIRGVATVGAVPTLFKDNVPNQRLAFWLASGELDPLVKNISEARTKLAEKRYSAVFVELPNRGREYLEDRHIAQLVRWIDALDKE